MIRHVGNGVITTTNGFLNDSEQVTVDVMDQMQYMMMARALATISKNDEERRAARRRRRPRILRKLAR